MSHYEQRDRDFTERNALLLEEEGRIDLSQVLFQFSKMLKHLLPVVILLTLVCAIGYWGIHRLSYTPAYTASAPFVVNSDSTGIVNEYSDELTAEDVANQFPQIINSSALQSLVKEELGVSIIPGTISVEQVNSTKLVNIKATASDPQIAYDILIAVLNNYESVSARVLGSTIMTPLRDPVVPTQVDNPFSNVGLLIRGALIGLAAGLLLVLILAGTRFTIKDKNDVKKQLNINYLGAIPRVTGRWKGTNPQNQIQITNDRVGFGFQEGVRIARTRIVRQLGVDEEGETLAKKSILVTAAAGKEGTTTVAMNLAQALAAKNKKVILVDCNFRNPGLATNYGLEKPEFSVSDVLSGKCELGQALVTYGENGLRLLPGGLIESDPSRLIASGRFGKLIQTLKEVSDYVILDTPPAAAVSDAGNIARHCDGSVLVIKQDETRISRIIRALEDLAESGTPVLGCVINQAAGGGSSYGYGYGYGYGYSYGYGYGYGESRRRKQKIEKS